MVAVPVLGREDQPPNPLWKFSVLTQVVCLVISGLLFISRCYVRLGFSRLQKEWILEDGMVVASFLGLLAFSIVGSVMANFHAGSHIQVLTDAQIQRIQWFFWWISVLYGPVALSIKLSILLLCRRLFVTTRHSCLWFFVNGIGVVCVLYYTISTFIQIFACTPMRTSWDTSILGHCSHVVNIEIAGVINGITDMAIMTVPTVAVLSMGIKVHNGVGYFALHLLGGMALVMSTAGFTVQYKRHKPDDDVTFRSLQFQLCIMAELTIGMICVCLPVVPVLFRKQQTEDPRESNSDDLNLNTPPAPEPGRYRKVMVARTEFNMLNEGNRTVAGQADHTNDLLDFLAQSGRIDDGIGGRVVRETQ